MDINILLGLQEFRNGAGSGRIKLAERRLKTDVIV